MSTLIALVLFALGAGALLSAAHADDTDGEADERPDPITVASNGQSFEAALAGAGLDAAWRATLQLGPIARGMVVQYDEEGAVIVVELLDTIDAIDRTTTLHIGVVAELRDAARARDEAVDAERQRLIERNKADSHLDGMRALLEAVAVDVFAGTGESDDVLLGADNTALIGVQRNERLRGHTLDEMWERHGIATQALADAEAALADAISTREELDRAHTLLRAEATALARARNDLDAAARNLLPAAAESFTLARIPRVTGLTPRAIEAYINAELTLQDTRPRCRISWRTIAAVGGVEGGHGTHGNRLLQLDGTPDRPIVGLALDGQNTDNFGEVVASIADTDGGRFDGDTVHDRAIGPMQFIPETWQRWQHDGDGDGVMDPQDLDDAALAAGAYLCNYGSQRDWEVWKSAVFGYNHSAAYVASVKIRHDQMRYVRLPEFEDVVEGEEIDPLIQLEPAAPYGVYVPMPIPEPEPEEGEAEPTTESG
jgi:membrane-bound lytic murein transglycosylase B